MRVGVTSYSYASMLGAGRIDNFGIIRLAAKQGYEGIEFAGFDEEYEAAPAAELKRACADAGILPAGYAVTADLAAGVARAKEKLLRDMDVAAEIGSPVLRTDFFHGHPLNPYAEEYVAAIRDLADEAKARGIALTTENHAGYFCSTERMQALVHAVAHENFGILGDCGNFMDAEEDPARAFALLAPYIRHVHLKDFHRKRGDALYPGEGWYTTRGGNYLRGAILGHGDCPLPQVLKALDQNGYTGWLIVEFEGVEDAEYACGQSLRYARRALSLLDEMRWHEGV